jgi:hypothetical protein
MHAGRTNGRTGGSVARGQFIVRAETHFHVPGSPATSRDRNEIRRTSVRAGRRVLGAHVVARPDVLRTVRRCVQERLQRVIAQFHGAFGTYIYM